MKIQIDLDQQLWNDFKVKVQGDGKTLREVVPTVFEPALRAFLEPTTISPPPDHYDAPQVKPTPPAPIPESFNKGLSEVSAYEESVKRITAPPVPTVKRCDLCDMPTPRTFNLKGRKVCYTCWRDGIINEGTQPTATTQ